MVQIKLNNSEFLDIYLVLGSGADISNIEIYKLF